MKVNDWAGVGNHTTAMFWEYDTKTGRRGNLDPKPNPSVSNYAAFNNNPIVNRDPQGDTVEVSDLYKKDDQGNYINKEAIISFELYASTKEGQGNLLSHAQKGFSLQGAFVKDLNINAEEEGNENDVDEVFKLGYQGPGGAGTTYDIVNGRLKLTYLYPNQMKNSPYWTDGNEPTLSNVNTMAHEPELHGWLYTFAFRNNYFVMKGSQHSNNDVNQANFLERQEGILSQAQTKLLNASDIRSSSQAVSISNLRLMIQIGRSNNATDPKRNTGLGTRDELNNYIQTHR